MKQEADLRSEGNWCSQHDWWRSAVIYQIYPRSFQDSNGDGVGDLRGIIDRLDYVASLGVDAIWISPFYRSPMKDFGYDVSDYCDVDPLFGRLDDFLGLLHQAHDLGLRVIIDQVWSHTSDQHPWFVDSWQPLPERLIFSNTNRVRSDRGRHLMTIWGKYSSVIKGTRNRWDSWRSVFRVSICF